MNTGSSSTPKRTRRISGALALLSITALALAASPTALAQDRGGPGAPSVQYLGLTGITSVNHTLPLRFASWSD